MAKLKTSFEKGLYCHLYNRGVNGQDIFLSDKNYSSLLRIIQKNIDFHHISMIAYCLMPNHYHFLCRYIHRNPLDTNPPIVEKVEDWTWANYPEWVGLRNGSLVDRDFIASLFRIRLH